MSEGGSGAAQQSCPAPAQDTLLSSGCSSSMSCTDAEETDSAGGAEGTCISSSESISASGFGRCAWPAVTCAFLRLLYKQKAATATMPSTSAVTNRATSRSLWLVLTCTERRSGADSGAGVGGDEVGGDGVSGAEVGGAGVGGEGVGGEGVGGGNVGGADVGGAGVGGEDVGGALVGGAGVGGADVLASHQRNCTVSAASAPWHW